MKSKIQIWILIAALAAGLVGGILLMGRDVTLNINGNKKVIHTSAFTVSQALRSAGISLQPEDKIEPAANSWLANVDEITLHQSRPVLLWMDPSGTQLEFTSAETSARAILAQAGLTPAAGDIVKVNGGVVNFDDPLAIGEGIALQYIPAIPLTVTENGKQATYSTTASTVGLALWQNGVKLLGADVLSVPFNQPIKKAMEITLFRAVPITITVDGKTINTVSSAATVGQALRENGITLQNLDYSEPSDDSAIPDDGKIKVIRVREEIVISQQALPFETEYISDDSLELGQTKVISEGQYGLAVERVRVRYEDGKEVSRVVESSETLQEPVNRKEAYGADVIYQTLQTEVGTITYYRAVTVRATSYSPCRSGSDKCYYYTASGKPVQRGVIAVTRAWYNLFQGDRLYVPGYGIGTIEDVGGGIPGQYWIDLGFSDADWELWSKTVTIYFLAPAPANVPGVLP